MLLLTFCLLGYALGKVGFMLSDFYSSDIFWFVLFCI